MLRADVVLQGSGEAEGGHTVQAPERLRPCRRGDRGDGLWWNDREISRKRGEEGAEADPGFVRTEAYTIWGTLFRKNNTTFQIQDYLEVLDGSYVSEEP